MSTALRLLRGERGVLVEAPAWQHPEWRLARVEEELAALEGRVRDRERKEKVG